MDLIKGVLYTADFVSNADILFKKLKLETNWDTRMKARKTASFGVAYNYSQMAYPYQKMPTELYDLTQVIKEKLGFEPNNCLVNFYENGLSKMGFHADQVDILAKNTGVAIVSLGETRILRFRNIADKSYRIDYPLGSGSLIYMNQAVQKYWQHAIPKSNTLNSRMSLTFRKMSC